MISALLGCVIMSMATVSLLIGIRLGEDAINNAGNYPLTNFEKNTIIKAGYSNKDLILIQNDIKLLPKK